MNKISINVILNVCMLAYVIGLFSSFKICKVLLRQWICIQPGPYYIFVPYSKYVMQRRLNLRGNFHSIFKFTQNIFSLGSFIYKSYYNDQFCLLSVLPDPRKAQKCAPKVNKHKYRDIFSHLAKRLKYKTISYSCK